MVCQGGFCVGTRLAYHQVCYNILIFGLVNFVAVVLLLLYLVEVFLLPLFQSLIIALRYWTAHLECVSLDYKAALVDVGRILEYYCGRHIGVSDSFPRVWTLRVLFVQH